MELGVGILSVLILLRNSMASENEESRLIKHIFTNYDKKACPSKGLDDVVPVSMKLTLTNLIDLNEKEETLTTNVWVQIQDDRLVWNETEYGGLLVVRVPHDIMWLPDLVLENNIDGNFEVAYYSNVIVFSTGTINWLPPAIFRSTCNIEITYFPFDWQNCSLVFRSKTYSAYEIDLQLVTNEETRLPFDQVDIDREAFTENGEWAIMHRPARKIINPKYSKEDLRYQEIAFNIIIQRKPLFYIINIIVPCVLISSLVVLVYFLPAKAGGQHSVHLRTPGTDCLPVPYCPDGPGDVPQCAAHWYLMFVMFVSTLIVLSCVIVLNVSLRSPSTRTKAKRVSKTVL
ncbi:hypothetical protein XELAEV_18000925mg [Xenopus laevis]|nr:hypothetical protein XELAEV_18000925mg [Xenopus laevis]